MSWFAVVLSGIVLPLQTPSLEGQSAPPLKASAKDPIEGIWPSTKLLNLMLHRWTDDMSDEFGLSAEQRPKVRQAVVHRWETFLTENRSTLQPLANEFLEMRLDREPPTTERVKAWAERARPAFEAVRKQIGEGTGEFRDWLTPEQRAKFELRALQLNVGLEFADRKLQQWQTGKVDVKDVWEDPGREGRERRRERRRERERERERTDAAAEAAQTESDAAADDPIAHELDSWEKYVAEFATTYEFDEGQRDAASSCLSELRQRAVAHRDTHREEIIGLESRIQGFSGADKELDELKKQLTRLYGPIDDLFNELRSRIEKLPTAEQRAKIAQRLPSRSNANPSNADEDSPRSE